MSRAESQVSRPAFEKYSLAGAAPGLFQVFARGSQADRSSLPKRVERSTFELSFSLPGNNHTKTRHQGKPTSQSDEVPKRPKS